MELLFRLHLVLSFDVAEHFLELLFAQRVAELLPALDNDHLIDRVHHDLWGDVVERLAQLHVVRVAFQIDLLALLAQRGDLALFEIALGEDFAVHLHEDLFDDFTADGRNAHEKQDRRQQTLEFHKYLEDNILSLIEEVAQ